MPDVIQQQNFNNQEVNDLLQRYGGQSERAETQEVIYGIYDNSAAPFWVRANDFFIDHSKVNLKTKSYFFHLMSVMIDAGIPLLQSLNILKKREENQRFRRVIATLHHEVSQGKNLSDAMSRFADVFSEVEIGVVKSGEAVGRLNDMLNRLSIQLEKNHTLQMKLVSSAIYPVAVIVTLLIVGTGMMIWVIPNLLDLLKQGGLDPSEFPFTTRVLVSFTEFIQVYWWAVLIGLLAIWGVFQVYINTTIGRFKWHYFKLKFPVVGLLMRKVYVLQFVRLLGILVDSGLPVLKTLQIIATSLNNDLYTMKTWHLIGKVQQGEKISANLETSPFLFPDTVSHMLSIAERTASLGTISEKIGDHYDREIDHSLKRLTSLFEPLMIVIVGLSVAFLALAVLTPIFKLTQVVGN